MAEEGRRAEDGRESPPTPGRSGAINTDKDRPAATRRDKGHDQGRDEGRKDRHETPATERRLIRRVVASRSKVQSGESVSVIVRTDPAPDGSEPVVRIEGAAGTRRFVQVSGPPGRRTLIVTAAAGRVVDTHRFEIEVVAGDACAPLPVLQVHGDPSLEATGIWSVTNAEDVHRPGAHYEWHYGGPTAIVTREPRAAISYADLLGPNERFKVFHTRLVVRYADQSLRQAKRSVTVWNRYALAKERGLVQPRVTHHFRPASEGDHLVGRARIINRDDEYVVFTEQQVQWLSNKPGAPASPSRPSKISIVLRPHSEVEVGRWMRLDAIPANAFGFGLVLRGTTRSGLQAHAAAYFEHHSPLPSHGVRVIADAALVGMLDTLREADCVPSKRRYSRAEIEDLAFKHDAKGEAALAPKVGLLFRDQARIMSGSIEGQECLPDQTPPEKDLACQLTDEWGWVAVPGRFVNARKGDVLLSPGSGGPILGVLRHVSPPQIFSHSAIMIENYYTLRHSTASEEWLQNHASDSFTADGSDGLEPEALQYIWPGTISQTAENAMEGEPFDDPDGEKDDFGAVKSYTLSAMTNGGLDPGDEIIDPLIVKPDPLLEAEQEWIRANLHRVADAAKAIHGHYRFFAYTDAKICGEASGPFLAPSRSGWWASQSRPTVCSALVWASAASLREPAVRLEGKGEFTQSSDVESTDVGGDVDFMTRDGLYFYTEAERQTAGDWLYNYFYNVVYQISGAGGVAFTDAASDLGNQICNTFAFDWSGWSDVHEDEAKDSELWKDPSVGRAVSPDNIMSWDPPTEFDGKTAHGLYGFTEALIYRAPYIEYRQISRWKRVPTKGKLLGSVRYKGNAVGGAIVNVGGQSLLSKAAGTFEIELPTGSYQVQSGKLLDAGYAEGSATAAVVAGSSVNVTVELQDPPELYRRLTLRGTMKIEDYEDFEDNEHATRNMARNSVVGPDGTHDEIQWTEKMGGEIRVELVLKIDWKIDLSIDIAWHVKLFEGTSEETSDLDGERSGTFKVPKDETKTLSFAVWNSDEDDPEDRADITFELTNAVRP